MYVPKPFKVEDPEKLEAFIKKNSFGILISTNQGIPVATPIPFIYHKSSNRLVSHITKLNTQWEQLDSAQVLVVFSGPHAYISPSWYEEKNTVPT